MPRSRLRESIKSLGSHIDPEKDEQLQNTKIEIDNKVEKIMKLIKKKNQAKKDGNLTTDSELVELIDDFHKQYQSIYALYDNLREEVREKVRGKENKEGSSSTSSSDTESYHSVDGASARSSPRYNLNSLSEEKEALHMEYMASLSKIQESEKIIKELRIEAEDTERTKQKLKKECSQLKEKLVEREKELFALTRAHQVQESKVPTQIKELERDVSSLKLENKNLCTQNRELEEKIESRAMEAKHLGEENSGLRAHILELEMKSKEKEDTLSALRRKLEENESNSMSKIEDLKARANNLQLEVDTLRSQKGELAEQVVFKSNEASVEVKGVMDQINVLQHELHSLSSQKCESDSSLEKVTQEISDFLIQIENLKEKLESKTMDLQRMLEEKVGLERQVKDLELEAGSLRSQKSELEEQMRSKNHEADQLRVEKEGLHVRISALQTKFEGLENDSSTKIKALGAEVNNLQQELDSSQAEKSQQELKIEREKQDLIERLTWMEKQNIELTSKIVEHLTTMKGQEAVINKLNEEHKQIRGQYLDSKLSLQIAEKKIEETAEEFCKKFEDSLRILSRRIRVAEQLHVENKDAYIKTKDFYKKQQMDFKERVASTEIAVKKMKDISLTTNDILSDLDAVALKFEQCSGNFLNRISKASCEVLFAKDWVRRKNNAIKHVQEDVDCLLAQLDTKEAEILGLREKVWKSENQVRELKKIVKEKEEGMLGMKEEKREAIRQLCVWIDYHRSRCDYLKKILSDMIAVRSQRTP